MQSTIIPADQAAEEAAAKLSGDEKTGADIVAKALQAPIRQIAANAGLEGAVILNNVKNSKKANYGFDAAGEVYGDDDLSRRRLYTATSRAMHEVTIFAQGQLTSLLDPYLTLHKEG